MHNLIIISTNTYDKIYYEIIVTCFLLQLHDHDHIDHRKYSQLGGNYQLQWWWKSYPHKTGKTSDYRSRKARETRKKWELDCNFEAYCCKSVVENPC